MYEQYYHLNDKPFGLTPDPRYRYSSQSHLKGLELLLASIACDECFAVVTGDAGTGKTTLCRALVEQSGRKTVMALLLNPPQSEEDLLKEVLMELGVVSRGDERAFAGSPERQDMMNAIQDTLQSLLPLGVRGVLVIDEAQNLPIPVLEQVRLLANLTADKRPLLQVVLVGQPGLTDVLRAAQLRHLDQRFSVRVELTPLTEAETSAYIAHRLAVAGPGRLVSFTPAALKLVHQLSGGVPRVVNLLSHRALLGGFSEGKESIDADIVSAAAEDLDLKEAQAPRSGRRWFSRSR